MKRYEGIAPGPWKVVNDTQDQWTRPMVCNEGGYCITDVINNKNFNANANAQAIADLPEILKERDEMYEELKVIRRLMDSGEIVMYTTDDLDTLLNRIDERK
jgi:hypothetical protein